MKKYCLFFDIDGTIIDTMRGKTKPSAFFVEAIRQLKENGHLCYIASGRPYTQISEEIKKIPFDGMILCNGALVIEGDQVILSHSFPQDTVKEIINRFDRLNTPYLLSCPKKSFVQEKFRNSFMHLKFLNISIGESLQKNEIGSLEVVKVETFKTKKKAAEYIEALKHKGYVIYEYKMFSTYEINAPGVSKGNAVADILKLHRIPLENSIAFGDGINDIEMLKSAGVGVAMNNASKEVKESADRITESCSNDGVVREIQRMGLINVFPD